LERLQIGANPRHGLRARIAAIPEIEHKPRISNGFSPKTGLEQRHFGEEIFQFV
jgi:hypothetical protein